MKSAQRKSIRLKEYDYSQSGAYFITICTQNRKWLFGNIVEAKDYSPVTKMILNDPGGMVEKCWNEIPKHFPNVELDEFVIMPNHVHGIVVIVGVQNVEPRRNRYQHIIPRSIGSIVRGFKIGVTKRFREKSPEISEWQRNYYEHVIRDDDDLNRVREYIQNNPRNWTTDDYFPAIGKEG